ncbi:hypothetical protein L1987_66214 [Smallanthus sonchifolius]|uniref:Uncharacterized protein n=1 Tax=Smallanthus sonchifolius TaxID=185202 RepID=A0ACB9BWT4_9ASTR|nr:hypothetical protein L1987_66214 [Smallanthus sonchifolius]
MTMCRLYLLPVNFILIRYGNATLLSAGRGLFLRTDFFPFAVYENSTVGVLEVHFSGFASWGTNTMECHTMSTSIQGLFSCQRGKKHISLVPLCLRKDIWKLTYINQDYYLKNGRHYPHWRVLCLPTTLEEEFSSMQSKNYSKDDEHASDSFSRDVSEQLVDSEQLKSLIADAERAKLLKKLSEANQHNRYLKRQLLVREDAMAQFKSELAVTELEIQALVNMAKEIASYGIPAGSKKINGKYIQSLLLLQLQGIQEKLQKQIKDVELAQSKEVTLFWSGMAESVQVMGSFDGWSHENTYPQSIMVLTPGSAMNASEEIGSCGGRNFVLYRKKNNQVPEARSRMITRHKSGRWKSCIVCLAQ